MTRAVTPNLRLGVLAWARQQARGDGAGLGWVDTTLRDDGRPFLPVEGPDGEERFRHAPYGLFLPGPMLESAKAAQARGEATALEGLLLLLARPEWLVAARHLLWTPLSPVPRLLAPLVEAFGIDRGLHRDDPSRLVRLLAHLPGFHPHRGDPEAAVALVRTALEEDLPVVVHAAPGPDEAFACRDASWWRVRGGSDATLVVRDGMLRRTAPAASPRAEDVAIARQDGAPIPLSLLRLLPVWATLRLQPPDAS